MFCFERQRLAFSFFVATFVLVSFEFSNHFESHSFICWRLLYDVVSDILTILQNSDVPMFYILATFVLVYFGFSDKFPKQRLVAVLYFGDVRIDFCCFV
jgi:hypothetical protein